MFGICVPCWLRSTGVWKSVVGTLMLTVCCRDKNGLVLAIYFICSVSDNIIGDENLLVNLGCLNFVGSSAMSFSVRCNTRTWVAKSCAFVISNCWYTSALYEHRSHLCGCFVSMIALCCSSWLVCQVSVRHVSDDDFLVMNDDWCFSCTKTDFWGTIAAHSTRKTSFYAFSS